MTHIKDVARELRSIRKGLDKLRAEFKAATEATRSQPHAVKRSVAAKLMGIGVTKLDTLIKLGKVRTADDRTLVPLSEVKRYTAPKAPRGRNTAGRRPALVIDETSPDAVEAMKRELRLRRAGAAR